MIEVMLNDERGCDVSEKTLVETVRRVLQDHKIRRGEVSLAIIDDAKMRHLNRTHLNHDYPTDVLSFLLCREGDHLEGEVIVSGETAARAAREYGWSNADELLLYVIHGALHLVGYDDDTEAGRRDMRHGEAKYLQQAGGKLPAGFFDPGPRQQRDPKPTSEEAPR